LKRQSKAAGTENVAARLGALEQKVGELNRSLAEASAAAVAACQVQTGYFIPPKEPVPIPATIP
jgi:hypothetical protein